MKAAIASAKAGDVLTLLRDVELSVDTTIVGSKDLTLDLNGKKLTSNAAYTISNYGILTIKDSVGGGKVENTNANGYAVYNRSAVYSAEGYNLSIVGGSAARRSLMRASATAAACGRRPAMREPSAW